MKSLLFLTSYFDDYVGMLASFSEYNFVEYHTHVEKDQSFGAPKEDFSKSNKQNYAVKMELGKP